jgi:hypothetical protein
MVASRALSDHPPKLISGKLFGAASALFKKLSNKKSEEVTRK